MIKKYRTPITFKSYYIINFDSSVSKVMKYELGSLVKFLIGTMRFFPSTLFPHQQRPIKAPINEATSKMNRLL
jgi:hypothetical protein